MTTNEERREIKKCLKKDDVQYLWKSQGKDSILLYHLPITFIQCSTKVLRESIVANVLIIVVKTMRHQIFDIFQIPSTYKISFFITAASHEVLTYFQNTFMCCCETAKPYFWCFLYD